MSVGNERNAKAISFALMVFGCLGCLSVPLWRQRYGERGPGSIGGPGILTLTASTANVAFG